MQVKESLSPKSIRNILVVLKKIWNSGCDQYGWDLRNPFYDLEEFIPEKEIETTEEGLDAPPPVWRFDEFMAIVRNIHCHYRNVTLLMVLTGLSASEIAGLRRIDIQKDFLLVRNFYSRGTDRSKGKRRARRRKLKMTRAIRACLEEAMDATEGEYLFRTLSGERFSSHNYWDHWQRAVRRTGFSHKRAYSTRHTFAAWALTLGMMPNQLVARMGHSSKKMVYETYGFWVEGLDKDREKILDLFGEDFLG